MYVLTHLDAVNGWSLAIGVGVLAIMLVSARADRRIPAALIGLAASTALVGALISRPTASPSLAPSRREHRISG